MQNPDSPLRKLVKFLVGGSTLLLVGGACVAGLVHLGVVSTSKGPNDWGAISAARDSVKARLVSPGSAEFPSGESKIAARTKDGQFVAVYVVTDSDNRMGALLRSYALALVFARVSTAEAVETRLFETSPTVQDLQALLVEAGVGWVLEDWVKGTTQASGPSDAQVESEGTANLLHGDALVLRFVIPEHQTIDAAAYEMTAFVAEKAVEWPEANWVELSIELVERDRRLAMGTVRSPDLNQVRQVEGLFADKLHDYFDAHFKAGLSSLEHAKTLYLRSM